MDLRLDQVLAAARARRAALSAETAGYIALGVADALAVSPGVIRESDVILDGDGNVTVSGAQRADDPAAAERSIRVLLQKALAASAGSSPALSSCSRRQPGNGLRALIEELEAALIPVNRAAARRAIGRLAREASKAPAMPSEPPRPAPRAAVREAPVAAPPPPRPAAIPVQPAPAAQPAADVFEAATEPEYTEQLGVAPAPPSAAVQQPVDTTPTELTSLEISEHTVPLEIIPAELTPGPESIDEPESQSAPVEPFAPPPVPDLEVGPMVRRPSPFLELSPAPPTPAPPTPAPPTPAPPTPAPPTPAPPTPAPLRADPHGLTPQLSTYDPHSAGAHLPPPPPASETPAWDSSYSERSRAVQPARVVPAVQPGPRHVETAQPPEVVLREPARVVPPTPAPPEVAEVPEPSVPIDVVMSATPPPAQALEPSVPIELKSATPPPTQAQAPEPSVPIEMAGQTPAPEAAVVVAPTPAPPTPAPPTPAPPTPAPPTPASGGDEPSASPPKAEKDGVGGVEVSGVDDLLASFSSGTKRSSREVAGELKKMVGLEPTPPPPEVATLTGSSIVSLPDGDRDEPAPMEPVEFRRPRAPRTSLAITTTLLILMLGAAVALYFFYPQVFTGR